MTGKERMLAFLNGQPTDRPAICPIFDRDYMVQAAGFRSRSWEEMDNADRMAVMEGCFRRHPQMDLMFCPTGRGMLPRLAPVDFRTVRDWETLRDVWGPAPTKEQIIASGIYDYMPKLAKQRGEGALLAFTVNVPLAHAMAIFGGYEQGLIALAEQPEWFKTVYLELCRRVIGFLEAGRALGLPAVWITQYYAGADTISPRVYREVVRPGENLILEAARNLGIKTLIWFLGDLMPVLDDLLENRPDALVLEPGRKGYQTNPADVCRKVGSAVGVCGYPGEDDMAFGRRERISVAIREQLAAAGVTPFAFTTPILKADTDPATVDFFMDEVVRWGTKK